MYQFDNGTFKTRFSKGGFTFVILKLSLELKKYRQASWPSYLMFSFLLFICNLFCSALIKEVGEMWNGVASPWLIHFEKMVNVTLPTSAD